MTALITIVALVIVATILGLLWRSAQGRVKKATGEAADFAVPGADVTILQFSTEVCSPCRAAHTLFERVAGEREGVEHVDVDITHRPDVASRFNVLQTPTTLLLDATGAVRARIGGAPRPATVKLELERLLTA